MDKLSACVKNTLRRGDVFARYSVSQFVIMLPLTTVENAEMVLRPHSQAFSCGKSKAPGEVTFLLQPIDSVF
jgi:GGDEF domain-containing protein